MHHDVALFLLALAVLLGVARGLGEIARRLHVPAVVGEILSGVLVGRTVLGRLFPGAYAALFPEGTAQAMLAAYTTVAVTLLLVVAGIEVDLTVVRRSGRTVFLTAALGMVIPFAAGLGLGWVLPTGDLADPARRGIHAAFLGIALAISALPVIARTLLDLGLVKTDLGLIVLSAAVVNDLVGWIGFSVLSRQFVADAGSPRGLLLSIALTVVFVVATLLVVRPLADRLLARLEASRGRGANGPVLTGLMVLSLLGAAATQALGMHAVFGGFVVGLAVGDSDRLREHTRGMLRDFVTSVFTPVFFATMALRVDFAASFDLRLIAIVFVVASLAKISGSAAGARLAGVRWRESLAIGFGLNSRGAMEILLAVLALEAGIINTSLFVALVVMAVVTSLISGPALSALVSAPRGPIASLLREGAVLMDVVAASPRDIVVALTGALARRTGAPDQAPPWAAAVLEREDLAATGVGEEVAIPHAEIDGLAAPLLAFGRTEDGVDFDAPDGKPVRLVFLLLTPPRDFDREVKVLAAIARLVIDPEVRRRLLHAADGDAVLSALSAPVSPATHSALPS